MREITGEEVREIQKTILNVVAEFCQANGIRYWIDCGTLLGAIRHGGYIPWDDDIDVGMLREDYERFSEIFNAHNDRYYFACFENTPSFYVPHGKVCDTATILYEPDEHGHKFSINIDIFVYDNAPDKESELERMFFYRDVLRKAHFFQNQHVLYQGNLVKYLYHRVRKMVSQVIFSHNLVEKMINHAQKYRNSQTMRVGNFTAFAKMSCNKRVFDSFVDVSFEGKQYKAPIGYDEWLRSFYGDYMVLPPEDKRVSHHKYKAYMVD